MVSVTANGLSERFYVTNYFYSAQKMTTMVLSCGGIEVTGYFKKIMQVWVA